MPVLIALEASDLQRSPLIILLPTPCPTQSTALKEPREGSLQCGRDPCISAHRMASASHLPEQIFAQSLRFLRYLCVVGDIASNSWGFDFLIDSGRQGAASIFSE